mmetsp:Transcript_124757/g.399722  ORF Transcript_124757/g.399722 Transcript_124757/m.399722 type:complete len:267 (-) Transcript_124757:273-1073(-)
MRRPGKRSASRSQKERAPSRGAWFPRAPVPEPAPTRPPGLPCSIGCLHGCHGRTPTSKASMTAPVREAALDGSKRKKMSAWLRRPHGSCRSWVPTSPPRARAPAPGAKARAASRRKVGPRAAPPTCRGSTAAGCATGSSRFACGHCTRAPSLSVLRRPAEPGRCDPTRLDSPSLSSWRPSFGRRCSSSLCPTPHALHSRSAARSRPCAASSQTAARCWTRSASGASPTPAPHSTTARPSERSLGADPDLREPPSDFFASSSSCSQP